jgi:hypothetical protein
MINTARTFLLLATALVASCHGVSTDLNPSVEIVTLKPPAELIGGDDGTFTCSIQTHSGAATLSWDFGGGATPNSGEQVATDGQATQTVTFVEVSEATEYTLKLDLQDNTNPNRHDSVEITYVVSPPPPPDPPAA